MEIRAIRAEELASLMRLYGHLHQQDDPIPSMVHAQAVWAQALASPLISYWGGYEQGLLVSSCTLTVIPNLTRACRPYGLIENVVTHSEHRGQGWARALLARALSEAWGQGCYKVMLLTGKKDEATLRFYEKAGFDRNDKHAFVARPPPRG